MIIRDEVATDIEAIRSVITAAFEQAPHSSGTETAIVDALRANNVLTLSLVAEEHSEVVGYVAYSPVSVGGIRAGWFGLGPVAVVNRKQRRGIGRALIESGLERLRAMGAQGCVVLGEPDYYARFGFESDANLRFPGVPDQYFRRLLFRGPAPMGVVEYHSAFY